jgi:hypothetical protein
MDAWGEAIWTAPDFAPPPPPVPLIVYVRPKPVRWLRGLLFTNVLLIALAAEIFAYVTHAAG